MTLTGLNLTAGLAALATIGLIACGGEMAGDDPLHDAEIARTGEDRTTTTLDPATTPLPADPVPNAPPEVVAPSAPADELDATDPAARPPGSPPPVLPDSPPN